MVIACINRAVLNNQLTQQEGNNLTNQYNTLVQANIANGSLSPTLAAALAAQTLTGNLRRDAAIMRLRTANQIRIQSELGSYLTKISASDNPAMAKRIIDSLFTTDYADRTAHLSLEGLKHHIDLQAKKFIAEGLANLDRKFDGHVDSLQQSQIALELAGQGTGNQVAATFANGFKQAMDYLADRYRAAGGALGKIADWDITHIHDHYKVKAAGKDEWIAFVEPMMDASKIISKTTNLPVTQQELRGVLEAVYHSISNDGLNKANMGFKGNESIANRWDFERTLHFKPDAWAVYNERFGRSDIVTTAENNLTNLAKAVAQMETFGPNVNVGKDFLKSVVKQELLKQDAKARANGDVPHSMLDSLKGVPEEQSRFDVVRQSIDTYIDEWFDISNGITFGEQTSTWAKTFSETRAYLAAAQLGSAVLNSVGDLGTLAWTAHLNDLPISKVMGNYISGLFAGKGKDESRVLAAELGLMVEHLQANILQRTNFDMAANVGMGGLVSDKVLRWSGLTRHTEAGRIAFSLSMAQQIAKDFSKTFDMLDDGLRKGLLRNDIDAASWNIIRQSAPINNKGIDHLNVSAVERLDAGVAARLSQYIQTETDRALIASGWKFDRFMLNMGMSGEIGRFASMYKRYPVLLMMNHIGRFINSPEFSAAGRAGTLVGFTLTMTVLGAVALTLKDITSGREPRNWFNKDDKMFWADAFFMGGAGGLVGDYIRSGVDTIRQGRSMDAITPMLNSTLGPGFGLLADIVKVPTAGVSSLIHGKPISSAGDEIANLTKYTPGNNLFYVKAATDRLFEDNVRRLADPKANDWFNRQIESRKKHYNQKYWWRPGRNNPEF